MVDMTSLLQRLGAFAHARHRIVLAGVVALITAVMAIAFTNPGSFTEGSSIPGSPAQKTLQDLERHFPDPNRATADVVFSAPSGDRVDQAEYRQAIDRTLRSARAVPSVVSVPAVEEAMLSPDKRTLVAEVEFSVGEDESVEQATLDRVSASGKPAQQAGLDVVFGGSAFVEESPPVSVAEGISLAVAFVILIMTFGSLLAAGLPLITAMLAVMLSLAGMVAAAQLVGIPSTAMTLSLMIGLAVGIDYALFIISRHRTQLAAGMSIGDSIARATATAGSAVVFAGLTVVIALAGLTVAGVPMLTGMGLSAAGAVAIAALLSVTLVPALLSVAGTRLVPKPNSRAARRLAASAGDDPRTMGAAWTRRVISHPRLAVVAIVIALGAAAIPAMSLKTAVGDDGGEPKGTPARVAYDTVGRDFGAGANGPLVALVTGAEGAQLERASKRVANEMSSMRDVAQVGDIDVAKDGQAARFVILPATGPTDARTKELVTRLQAASVASATASGAQAAITGQTAVDIDVAAKLQAALIPFGLTVVGLSLLLLLVAFRSIAIPIKATFGFLLSLGAAFGATVAVFQWGWLAGMLDIPVEGPVGSFVPIVVMAVLFGLAMDYEVFMVSAIREEYVRTGDVRKSIVAGSGHASRVVTAAALIMIVVFGSFLTHADADIKAIALALAVGVLVDAFVVRMTLVPAVLALLGHRAWKVPAWLDRILPHVDLEGGGETHADPKVSRRAPKAPSATLPA